MNHISKTLTITFLLIGQLSIGQDIYRLNLDSAIAIAKKQSYEMRYLRENFAQAAYQLKYANAAFLPNVKFNGLLPQYVENLSKYQTSEGLNSYSQKQSTISGSLEIKQKLLTDGTLSFNSDAYRLSDLVKATKDFNFTTGVSIDQPLQAFYAYNSVLASYKQARLKFELASKQYKRQELDLTYNVSSLFYSLVSAEKEKEIAFQNLSRQSEAFKLAKNKYEAGLIKEVEALQIEVDMGEAVNSYDEKVTSYLQNASQLKQALGIPLKDSIITESMLEYQPVFVDINKAIELGLKNRPEIREKEIQVELGKLDIKSQRAIGLPQGNVSAYYNFIGDNTYGVRYSDIEGFKDVKNAMLTRPGNRGITLSLQVPILDWGANRSLVKLQKSRLEQNKLTLNNELITIENDLRNTVSSLQSSLRRLQLLEKNVKLAEKSYDISYQRFTNGDIDVESLGLDRQRFNNAKLSYLRAYISYKLLLLDLNRKTFYDFEKNVSLEP